MKHTHVMTDADQDAADELKNEMLDLCLKRTKSTLVALSAARCVAEGLEQIINEKQGEVFTAPAPPTQTEGEQERFVCDADRWRHDLTAAGWKEESATAWQSPDGGLYRGPAGAWKELQRRKREAGQWTPNIDDWPIPSVLEHLANATEYLLNDLNCDAHGWETWKYAAEAARKHVALLTAAAPADTAAPKDALIQLLNAALLHPELAEGNVRQVIALLDAQPATATAARADGFDLALRYMRGDPTLTDVPYSEDGVFADFLRFWDAQTPHFRSVVGAVFKAAPEFHFPAAGVEAGGDEQSAHHDFLSDKRCFYCRNKHCHDAKAHDAAIAENVSAAALSNQGEGK